MKNYKALLWLQLRSLELELEMSKVFFRDNYVIRESSNIVIPSQSKYLMWASTFSLKICEDQWSFWHVQTPPFPLMGMLPFPNYLLLMVGCVPQQAMSEEEINTKIMDEERNIKHWELGSSIFNIPLASIYIMKGNQRNDSFLRKLEILNNFSHKRFYCDVLHINDFQEEFTGWLQNNFTDNYEKINARDYWIIHVIDDVNLPKHCIGLGKIAVHEYVKNIALHLLKHKASFSVWLDIGLELEKINTDELINFLNGQNSSALHLYYDELIISEATKAVSSQTSHDRKAEFIPAYHLYVEYNEGVRDSYLGFENPIPVNEFHSKLKSERRIKINFTGYEDVEIFYLRIEELMKIVSAH